MVTKLLYVEDYFENSRLEVITCLKNGGNLSSSWCIINCLSKLSLAEDRQPLVQHFFLLPGIELERWMYPQPWTQGAFHKLQGWWNIYWPFTYLHAILEVLFNLAAARCLDSHSWTAGSSLAITHCADLCATTPGVSCLARCWSFSSSLLPQLARLNLWLSAFLAQHNSLRYFDLRSWTAGSSLAPAHCADSGSTTPVTSLATSCCADSRSTTPGVLLIIFFLSSHMIGTS